MSPNNGPSPLPSRAGGRSEPAGDEHSGGWVHLVDYDPKWPYLFQREAERIREFLGGKALRVEHVGSTAVPGLVAKPCVDVLLVVADAANEDAYLPSLEQAGYTLHIREPGWHEHRVFKGPDVNMNLHVFSDGSVEVDRMLRFRDRLRADSDDRGLYAQAKRALVEKKWERVQDYTDAKSGIVEEIIARTG
ncbi:GrpB family protein [Allosalinactinospora lopnorensis]|uniref:GrpB family protein n=1 Tax=Allosalinactinospora lopnorensis TaxID=1352348 RepID=UPI000696AB4D|nr:GrpB family protein [Allosalinactinospora lopnorensis]